MAHDDDAPPGPVTFSSVPPEFADQTVVSQAPAEMMEDMDLVRAQNPLDPTAAHLSSERAISPDAAAVPRPAVAVGGPPRPGGQRRLGAAGPGARGFGGPTRAGLGGPPAGTPGPQPFVVPPPPADLFTAPPRSEGRLDPIPPDAAPTQRRLPDFSGGDEDVDPTAPTMLRDASEARRVFAAAGLDPSDFGPRITEPLATPAPFSAHAPPQQAQDRFMSDHHRAAFAGTAPMDPTSQATHAAPPSYGQWQGQASHLGPAPPRHGLYPGYPPPARGVPRWMVLAIVGAAAGVIVLVVLAVGAFFFMRRPRPARRV